MYKVGIYFQKVHYKNVEYRKINYYTTLMKTCTTKTKIKMRYTLSSGSSGNNMYIHCMSCDSTFLSPDIIEIYFC